MGYPFKNWSEIPRGFKFKQPYPQGFGALTGKPHLGIDYLTITGTEGYAPFDGDAVIAMGSEGGRMILFYPTAINIVIRFLHLSKVIKSGRMKMGEHMFLTGGKPGADGAGTSTKEHCHIDISSFPLNIKELDKFIDPDLFFKENNMNRIPLTFINGSLDLRSEVERLSDGVFSIDSRATNVPFTPPTQGILDQEQAYQIADQVEGRYLMIFYPGNPTSTFASSYYYPKRNCCISVLPLNSTVATGVFELSHQLAYYANENLNAHIQVEDSNFPDDAFTRRKYNVVKPYASQLVGIAEDIMTKQEVERLQILEGYSDPVGVAYWTGKKLGDYLSARLQDKVRTIQSSLNG